MPGSRAGLFESLRQLLHTALELAQVRLELLVADLQLEKLRLVEVALRALLGLLLLGLGLLLLIGFLLILLWDGYRLPALGVLTLLCIGGGLLLLNAAKRRLREGDELLAATRAEFERDRAALRPRD
ncbi:MAG: phage holin family protein [Burkholderiaceae bacterium]|jgi:uncharacterized membrane protein YqjE|nr:phage holin family protein [Burkholderiaceae bacterium]MCU0964849.1 phage holin family protein [Burkholderiaceae bacterium]